MLKTNHQTNAVISVFSLLPICIFLITCFSDIMDIVLFKRTTTSIFDVIVCVAALGMIFVLHLVGFEWLSAPCILLGYLWLFHFGMTLVTSIDANGFRTFTWYEAWTMENTWQKGLLYSLICFISFVIGSAFAKTHYRGKAQPPHVWKNELLFRAGMVCFFIGVLFLIQVFFSSGGFSLFSKSYVETLEAIAPKLGKSFAFLSTGILMAGAGAPKHLFKWVVLCQLPITLFFLALGMRQMGLPVPLMLFVLAFKRGIKFDAWKLAIIVFAFMWVIVFAKATRDTGSGITKLSNVSISSLVPLDAIIEMGSTLQTVSLVFQWIENGDDYRYGGGYLYGVERIFRERNESSNSSLNDPRCLDGQILLRAPGIGGSSIAESYFNFGLFGSLVFFLPLGYMLAILDQNTKSPATAAIVSIALLIFVMQARGYFSAVPAFIIYAIFCWCLQLLWMKRIRLPRVLSMLIIPLRGIL